MRRALSAIALISLLAWSVAASAGEPGARYPVRLTAQFEGGSFEAWAAEIDKSLMSFPIVLYRRENPHDRFYWEWIRNSDELFEENDQGRHRTRVRPARSCRGLFAGLRAHFDYRPRFGPDSFAWMEEYRPTERDAFGDSEIAELCRVVQAIRAARPSHRSHLEAFSLSAATPELLPFVASNFGLTPSATANEAIRDDARRRGLSWAAWRREAYCEVARYGDWYTWLAHLDEVLAGHAEAPRAPDGAPADSMRSCSDPPPLRVDVRSPVEAIYVEPWLGQFAPNDAGADPFESQTSLVVLAFGDFTGDGIEDVLIRNQYDTIYATPETPESGRGHATELFYYERFQIFSRFGDNAMLTLVQVIGPDGPEDQDP